ncbi:hypothetical protein [Bacillus alveayuensis]|uniref:hypothetical protein n=1 Tax=Aeribacillus alveayuensis TaxID=279215 RepID=UPI001364B1EE|nr:hypothetical protein [Bacillus alveayuensis]
MRHPSVFSRCKIKVKKHKGGKNGMFAMVMGIIITATIGLIIGTEVSVAAEQ